MSAGGGCALVVNGRRLAATPGQTLLNAALAGGTVIPHDCVTGQCQTCRVRVYAGTVDDAGTGVGGTVLACQARIVGDAVVEFDAVPDEVTRKGSVSSVVDLTPDIVEVTVVLERRLTYLPGQYVKATFRGLPARDYSPTLRADGSGELNELIFQVRREPGGIVSSELGRAIVPGCPTRIRGPFGRAYHRPGPGRLVLVSSGVGWAPIWAVARACRFREPDRILTVVAGARHEHNLYMRPSLQWLREQGATTVLTCSGGAVPADAHPGRTTMFLPRLNAGDTVMAAGKPAMVAAIELLAAAGSATCYADPFYPAATLAAGRSGTFLGRILQRLSF